MKGKAKVGAPSLAGIATYDYVIVGAGLSGLVFAERVANVLGKRVLILDFRNQIGGNCYDYVDDEGNLIHKFGPHYFRTNSKRVISYLDKFTDWQQARYKVLSHTDGRLYDFPINLRTFRQMRSDKSLSENDFLAYLEKVKVKNAKISNSEDAILASVGNELFAKFYKNYTFKQWAMAARELPASICRRVPIRTNLDDRYFDAEFQAMPADGYAAMFENILAASRNVELVSGADFFEEKKHLKDGYKLVYSGRIDRLGDYKFGRLKYRSLEFNIKKFTENACKYTENSTKFAQAALQINYPNDFAHTRSVETNRLASPKLAKKRVGSALVFETPRDYDGKNIPYYPIPTTAENEKLRKYKKMLRSDKLILLGRLGLHRYINMDEAVKLSLQSFHNHLGFGVL